jgi:predicted lipid-binding transport protein (Tim44 family)
MKILSRLLLSVFAVILISASVIPDAEARRLGGGSSFGMQRNVAPSQSVAPRPVAPPPVTPAGVPPSPSRSPMWGMLGGLALGAGLGALLGGSGFGGGGMGGIFMLLLLVGGVVLLFRMLGRKTLVPQPAGASPQPVFYSATPAATSSPVAMPAATGVPADFDVDGFLRQAKLHFVRLQAANDAGNMEDIKTFSTPEFYAEIEMQYIERGKTKQQTDIVQLDARLLDLASEDKRHIASVHFSGLLREAPDSAPVEFAEIWHLIKPVDDSSGWVAAGIQQL